MVKMHYDTDMTPVSPATLRSSFHARFGSFWERIVRRMRRPGGAFWTYTEAQAIRDVTPFVGLL